MVPKNVLCRQVNNLFMKNCFISLGCNAIRTASNAKEEVLPLHTQFITGLQGRESFSIVNSSFVVSMGSFVVGVKLSL